MSAGRQRHRDTYGTTLLVCDHVIVFYSPPKQGERVWCIRCAKYVTVKHKIVTRTA